MDRLGRVVCLPTLVAILSNMPLGHIQCEGNICAALCVARSYMTDNLVGVLRASDCHICCESTPSELGWHVIPQEWDRALTHVLTIIKLTTMSVVLCPCAGSNTTGRDLGTLCLLSLHDLEWLLGFHDLTGP